MSATREQVVKELTDLLYTYRDATIRMLAPRKTKVSSDGKVTQEKESDYEERIERGTILRDGVIPRTEAAASQLTRDGALRKRLAEMVTETLARCDRGHTPTAIAVPAPSLFEFVEQVSAALKEFP